MFAIGENAGALELILTESPLCSFVGENQKFVLWQMFWDTDFRGTLLLCTTTYQDGARLPNGYAVGTIELVSIVKNPIPQRQLEKFTWIFKNPRFIEPVYVKAGMGLFEVSVRPRYIENSIEAAYNLYEKLKLIPEPIKGKTRDKIDVCYYYHPTDKYYLLWDDVRSDKDGNLIRPKFTTALKPPDVKRESGLIPVFDEDAKKWVIERDSFPRPNITVIAYEPITKNNIDESIPQLVEFPNGGVHVAQDGIAYDINNLFCPLRFMGASYAKLRFSQLISYTNRKIFQLYQWHASMIDTLDISWFYRYRFTAEEIVHNLKRIFDVLVIEIYLKINLPDFIDTQYINFDSIGDLMNEKNHRKNLDALRVALYYERYKSMYKVLNNIDNGLKHEVSSGETDHIYGVYEPVVFLTKSERQNYNKLVQYQVPVRFLVTDANSALKDILRNRLWEK